MGTNDDIEKLADLLSQGCELVELKATLRSLVRNTKFETVKEVIMELKRRKGMI